jgi:trehalose 6-phosphate phosphatase
MQSDAHVPPTAARAPAPAVFPAASICLFLDFDGTLVEFADHPQDVLPDPQLVRLLHALQRALDGAVALITGRRIEELDVLLHPLRLPVAGLHGLERRDAQGRRPLPRPVPAPELRALRARLLELVSAHPGLLLEDKLASLAVHYRRAPQLQETLSHALAALVAPLLPYYEVVPGDMVLEIKPADRDKATAVEAFMREEPFAGRLPVFVGDDLTDSDGFGAVRRFDGMSVAVGDRVSAQWQLPDPAAVRDWLQAIAATGSRERP